MKESIAYNSVNSNLNNRFMENSINGLTPNQNSINEQNSENIHQFGTEDNGYNITNFEINQNNNLSDQENSSKNYASSRNRSYFRHSNSARNNQKYMNNDSTNPYYSNGKNYQIKVNYQNQPRNNQPINMTNQNHNQSFTKSHESSQDCNNVFVKKPPIIKSESIFCDKKQHLKNQHTHDIEINPVLNKTMETPERKIVKPIINKFQNNFIENSEKRPQSYKKNTLQLSDINNKPQNTNYFINKFEKPQNINPYINKMDTSQDSNYHTNKPEKSQNINSYINTSEKPQNINSYSEKINKPQNLTQLYSNKNDKPHNTNPYMDKIDT